MKTYVKPLLLANDELAEGVYAASGATTSSECFLNVTANIHQRPQQGRGDYRIQVSASHAASDGHHSSEQRLTLTFNQPVEYSGSNGNLLSGSGTATLVIKFTYHGNATENIGMGDVVVVADQGLEVTGQIVSCNLKCNGH